MSEYGHSKSMDKRLKAQGAPEPPMLEARVREVADTLHDWLIDHAEIEDQERIDFHSMTVASLTRFAEQVAQEERDKFSEECKRFHGKGPKCITCGRKDEEAIRLDEHEWAANEARSGNNGHDPSERIAAAIRKGRTP